MKAEKLGKRSEKAGELKIRRSEQTAIKTFVLHVACVGGGKLRAGKVSIECDENF